MPGNKPKLVFWHDFASTYSFLTALRIEDACREAGVDLIWKPFLLGPIFASQGMNNSPFNIYPLKGRYMWRDLERQARFYGIAFEKPTRETLEGFPRNSLHAARIAIHGHDQDWGAEFSRQVFAAEFQQWLDIGDMDVLAKILESMGVNAEAAIDASKSDSNKNQLKANTEEAANARVFGAPSFTVDQELFWGDDRLEAAIRHASDGWS